MRRLMFLFAALTCLAPRAHAGEIPAPGSAAGRPARPLSGPSDRSAPVRPWLASASGGAGAPEAPAPDEGGVESSGGAAPEAVEEPEAPAATVEFAVSTTNRYLYHGLLIEDEGLIVQSSIDVHVPLLVGDGFLRKLDLGGMLWTSLSTGLTGTGGDTDAPRLFAEADLSLSLNAELEGGWSWGVTYLRYEYPNGSSSPAQEISSTLAFDDSPHWPAEGRFRGLSPTATLAYEIEGQSDGGLHEGLFLGIGVAPRLGLSADPEGPALSFPITAGFSLYDYYEDAEGNDQTFGYVELGPELELPLGGREGGPSFSVTFGLHVLLAGEHVKLYNDTDEPELIGFVTFTTSF